MRRSLLIVAITATACISYTPRPLDPKTNAAAIEQRRLDDPALHAFVEKSLDATLPQWPPATWSVDTLTAAALYFNPDVAVARAAHATDVAGIATAGERPNPVLSASLQRKNSDPGLLSPWVSSFGIDFPFELPAKRRGRIAQATENAAASEARIGAVAWGVRSRIRGRMLDIRTAGVHHDLLARQQAIQKDIVEIFTKRLQLGEAAQPDLSRARVALYQTTLLIADADRLAAEARAGIAGALGVPESAIGTAGFAFTPIATTFDPALRDQALTGRPDVIAALHDFAAADAALRLEVARQYPDIHLQPAFGWDQGTRTWTVGGAAEIPVMNQHRGPIGEALARREEMATRFTAMQTNVLAQWDAAIASATSARRKLDAATAVLREAERQFVTVQQQFDAGEIDRLALDSSKLELEAARLAQADAEIDLQQTAGAVEDALQRPLPEEHR